MEAMERAWRANRASVHASWDAYFSALEGGVDAAAAFEGVPAAGGGSAAAGAAGLSRAAANAENLTTKVAGWVRAVHEHGHEAVELDPLRLERRAECSALQPSSHGLSERDMGATVDLSSLVYGGAIGVQFMHVKGAERRAWLRAAVESRAASPALPAAAARAALRRLLVADGFEQFFHKRFTAQRFGIDGLEVTVPALEALLECARRSHGVTDAVMGMPHRGRLSVLAHVLKKPYTDIFREYIDADATARAARPGEDVWQTAGDVSFHKGQAAALSVDGQQLYAVLLANPSHLEVVNPVVLGKARAKQDFIAGRTGLRAEEVPQRRSVLPVLLHGDGAFTGNGVVMEALQLKDLEGYSTCGTVHIVMNNQLGFTTEARDGRSTPYCTDVARAFDIPVLHVNADDVPSVVAACEIAVGWRQRWGSDIIVEIVGYRRYGHNELDDPSFTSPRMYKAIGAHPRAADIFAAQLIAAGQVSPAEVAEWRDKLRGELEEAYTAARTQAREAGNEWKLKGKWAGIRPPTEYAAPDATGAPLEVLLSLGRRLAEVPGGFSAHRVVARVFAERAAAMEKGQGVDWGFAEALAIGCSLRDGMRVRLSGQDVARGSFCHRHAVIYDQATGAAYSPLSAVVPGADCLMQITNSPLAETAELGESGGACGSSGDSGWGGGNGAHARVPRSRRF